MGHFHITNSLINTSEDEPMRSFEIVDAQSQMELWKLITDSVWQAISRQDAEQRQLDAQQPTTAKTTSKAPKPFKSKVAAPMPTKTKKTSAQEIQRQKLQANAVKSKPVTTLPPGIRDATTLDKNHSKA